MKAKKLLKRIVDHPSTPCFIKEWIEQELTANKPQDFKCGDLIQSEGHLIRISNLKESLAYGFGRSGDWYGENKWSFKRHPEDWKPADPKIWEQKLIEECKRRGVWDTPDIEDIRHKSTIRRWEEEYYDIQSDSLWSEYGLVYEKGKFATPSIPQYTQEEAEKKFSIKIVNRQ